MCTEFFQATAATINCTMMMPAVSHVNAHCNREKYNTKRKQPVRRNKCMMNHQLSWYKLRRNANHLMICMPTELIPDCNLHRCTVCSHEQSQTIFLSTFFLCYAHGMWGPYDCHHFLTSTRHQFHYIFNGDSPCGFRPDWSSRSGPVWYKRIFRLPGKEGGRGGMCQQTGTPTRSTIPPLDINEDDPLRETTLHFLPRQ